MSFTRARASGIRKGRCTRRGRLLALLVTGVGLVAPGNGALAADNPGDADTGRALFSSKHCVRCHVSEGKQAVGPALGELRRPQGEMELAGRLWNHAPAMFATLAREGLEWPRISAREMADLMAYLRADPARDPEPDLFKGQVTLLRKGCLKCHSLRREGGRVEPDLAEPRSDYESAAAWAAAMWTHAPAMVGMAGQRGIQYPRFSGDEMGNLVGFLKHAATTSPPSRSGTGRGR
jgi:cytochrome c551/c552